MLLLIFLLVKVSFETDLLMTPCREGIRDMLPFDDNNSYPSLSVSCLHSCGVNKHFKYIPGQKNPASDAFSKDPKEGTAAVTCADCPQGYGSTGTNVELLKTKFNSNCSKRTIYGSKSSDCGSWELKDNYLTMKAPSISSRTANRVRATFEYNFEFESDVYVEFKIAEKTEKPVFRVFFDFEYEQVDYNFNNWNTFKVNLKPGPHIIAVELAQISSTTLETDVKVRSINIPKGMAGVTKCEADPAAICPANHYKEKDQCVSCPEGKHSKKGSTEASQCTEYKLCEEDNILLSVSECKEGKKTVTRTATSDCKLEGEAEFTVDCWETVQDKSCSSELGQFREVSLTQYDTEFYSSDCFFNCEKKAKITENGLLIANLGENEMYVTVNYSFEVQFKEATVELELDLKRIHSVSVEISVNNEVYGLFLSSNSVSRGRKIFV